MSNTLDDVKRKLLAAAKPTEGEEKRTFAIAQKTLEKIANEVERKEARRDENGPYQINVEVGGSFAKGTWLKGEGDIDIFVKFPVSTTKEELESEIKNIGLSSFSKKDIRLRYSEHPYVEAFVDGLRVNLVPCYNVERGKWMSAADRSPFHTKYVNDLLSKDHAKRNEIRVFKKFVKLCGVYGAEIKVSGFSGYVCELLVLSLGGNFESAVEACASFKKGEIIPTASDISPAQKEILLSDEETTQAFLKIPDPIDPTRNLGRAISPQSAGRLSMDSRLLLRYPKTTYDSLVRSGLAQGKGQHKATNIVSRERENFLLENVVAVKFSHSQRPVDVLWGQLKRTAFHLATQLRKKGFDVLRKDVASNEINSSAIFFLVRNLSLPGLDVRIGPEVEREKESLDFLSKNLSFPKKSRNVKRTAVFWVGDDGRVYSVETESETQVQDFLEEILRLGKEREGKVASTSGVAPGLKKEVSNSAKIFVGEKQLMSLVRKESRNRKMGQLSTRSWILDGIQGVVRPNFPIVQTRPKERTASQVR